MQGPQVELNGAIEAHKAGRLIDAEAAYRRVLERRPNDPDALNFLGMLRCQMGNPADAVEFLGRAVEADPNNPHACVNLGNVLVILKRFEEARTVFTRATELAPDLPKAWFNLGVCLGRCKRPQEAASALHRALKLEPGYLPAYESLAFLLQVLGSYAEAAEVYTEWLKHDPDSPIARHMQAATTGLAAPPRAADDYIRNVFDDFAGRFDEKLAFLGYRAPQLLADRLSRESLEDRIRDVLDAGCGTGLCAPLLRPLARTLVGVDLSAGMIEKARARGGYDELNVQELCAFMRSRPCGFDIVVSADTLVYFGALEEPLAAARRCLRTGGILTFTLERLGPSDADRPTAGEASYRLEAHGRYSHAESYVRQAAAEASFEHITVDTGVLRRERGSDVAGLIFLARAV